MLTARSASSASFASSPFRLRNYVASHRHMLLQLCQQILRLELPDRRSILYGAAAAVHAAMQMTRVAQAALQAGRQLMQLCSSGRLRARMAGSLLQLTQSFREGKLQHPPKGGFADSYSGPLQDQEGPGGPPWTCP